jgi:hypothetical protein
MGESESKALTSGWTPEPKPHDQHQADLQAEIRRQQELELLSIPLQGKPTTAKVKKRRLSLKTQALYARVREVPRKVWLKEFCRRQDAMQRRFPMPPEWLQEGCNPKLLEAWKDRDWRQRIHDLRQNAWRPENQPENLV